jgi:hypothetical protein
MRTNGETTGAVKAIETRYKGYRFRSRLEARWAVFLDTLGVPYEYEPQGFDLGEAGWYLPDFWLPRDERWLEIKPGPAPDVMSFYLAGKMTDWREGVDLRGHSYTGPDFETKAHNICLHGSAENARELVIDSCKRGIRQADVVFCWIDSLDCYGTLLEIGYTRALLKRVVVAVRSDVYARLEAKGDRENSLPYDGHDAPKNHAMWFIEAFCDGEFMACRHPQEALDNVVPRASRSPACVAPPRRGRCCPPADLPDLPPALWLSYWTPAIEYSTPLARDGDAWRGTGGDGAAFVFRHGSGGVSLEAAGAAVPLAFYHPVPLVAEFDFAPGRQIVVTE